MSEIEKMYENAEIEKEVIKGCYDYYSKLGIDIWKENDCAGKNCDTCKKDKSIKRYPPFTAEKQIHIIKWLSDKADYVDIHYDQYKGLFNIQTGMGGLYVCNEFEQALASRVNTIWQDLTEEDKQQIRDILE